METETETERTPEEDDAEWQRVGLEYFKYATDLATAAEVSQDTAFLIIARMTKMGWLWNYDKEIDSRVG